MKSLLALVVTVLTACAIAHPGDRTTANKLFKRARYVSGPQNDNLSEPMTPIKPDPKGRESVNTRYPDYIITEVQKLMENDRTTESPIQAPSLDLLDEEIERIEHMPEKIPIPYKTKSEMPWLSSAYQRIIGPLEQHAKHATHPSSGFKYPPKPIPTRILYTAGAMFRKHPIIHGMFLETTTQELDRDYEEKQKERKTFALTPFDVEYFTPTETGFMYNESKSISEGTQEGAGLKIVTGVDRRHSRQNPNLSRTKTLVAEDRDKGRKGVDSDTYDPEHVHMLGTHFSRETIYTVGVAAGVATIILSITGITYGFYVFVKRAKAAGAMDYPAYGVTGPMDYNGDRRLAQSAQMYHYQHQKQQIIAMERTTNEQRNGSLSDLDSDDQDEGDYTVFECPGFATTGAMEVKNPLFEELTPSAPNKVQVFQPQLKE